MLSNQYQTVRSACRSEQIKIKHYLTRSIEKHQSDFKVLFQPIWSLSSPEKLCGYEALARWNNPFNIGPDQFIPVIESDNKLRRQFAALIAHSVVESLNTLLLHNHEVQYVSLNVSYADLNEPNYIEVLRKLISVYPSVRNHLVIEVTESQRVVLTESFIKSIIALQELGIGLALDDLGAGYADFNSLRLPIWSIIKIDKHHVCGIDKCSIKWQALKFTVEQCLSYSSRVIVEGVETYEQHFALSQFNLEFMVQGYYYSKPLAYCNILNSCSKVAS